MKLGEALATFRGHRTPHIDFTRRRRYWFAFSGLLIALSLVGLFARGLNFSIAFTGGASLEFENRSGAGVEEYQSVLARFGRGDARIERVGANQINIRTESLTELDPPAAPPPTPTASPTPTGTASPTATPTASPTSSPTATPSPTASPTPSPTTTGSPTPATTATPSPIPSPRPTTLRADRLRVALAEVAGISPDEINEQDVGPTWGGTISRKAVQGLVVFLVLVSLYITLRFELKMAMGAVAAMLHDLVITAGIYALVGREVTPETVIAILTILGYSLYDTVVIYDKIKENAESAALVARETYSGVVDLSLNQTLMRSVNTSLVVLLPIGALLLFGGETLKDFAFALFVGVASGAYSSVFIAAPLLSLVKEREPRYQQIRLRAQQRAARPGLRVVAATEEPTTRELEPVRAGAPRTSGATVAAPTRPRSTGPKKRKGKPQGKPKRRRR